MPVCLAEMITLAERLGADTDFVRVDLYDVDGRIVFGELTSFPAGGDSPFDPESFNEVFGRPWTVHEAVKEGTTLKAIALSQINQLEQVCKA